MPRWYHDGMSRPLLPVVRTTSARPAWPVEAMVFAVIALVALGARLMHPVSDSGGRFLQIWMSIIGLIFFAKVPRLFSIRLRVVLAVVLVPLLAFLLFGTLYFAPQSLFPFLLTGMAVVAVPLLVLNDRAGVAVFVMLISLLLPLYWVYGVRHMTLVSHLRHLGPDAVREVRVHAEDGAVEDVVLDDRRTLDAIVAALRGTYPYGSNHEHLERVRQVSIRLSDGGEIGFRIGRGSRTSSRWLEFGVEQYQNEALFELLEPRDGAATQASGRGTAAGGR